MTDQQTNSGTPGGSPGGNASGNTGGSFVAQRVAQMAETMPAQLAAHDAAGGGQPAGDVQHEHAGDVRHQQQQPGAPAKIKIGSAEYLESDVQAAIAERAEAQVRRSGLPSAPEGYEVKTTEGFRLPEGVPNFQFDMKDPTLAAARKFALDNGLNQQQFSHLLDLHVASKAGELLSVAHTREVNLQQLGAAGPQRIESIATWLGARAGKDGAAVANFLKAYPSAPIVRAMETLIKQFTNQGGADYSGQHRETADAEPGKIPGYDKMSFAQVRARQMAERMRSDPNYARDVRPGGRRGE